MNKLDKDTENWVQVANAVLAGQYIRAKGSEVDALKIGLRSIEDPQCAKALEMLRGNRAK